MKRNLFLIMFLLSCAKSGASDIVLIDFGSDENSSSYEHPLWQTAFLDRYTDYVDIGPGGTTITTGSNSTYNYQGVQGEPLFFNNTLTIKVVWYNNTGTQINFYPNISFNDPDRMGDGISGQWYVMSQLTLDIGATGESIFQFDLNTQGLYSLINVNGPVDVERGLICDKIILQGVVEDTQPPTIPQNLSATPQSPYEILLNWSDSTDNTEVTGYRIFRDNILSATVTGSHYSDTNLSPSRIYQYRVTAYDFMGNESGLSSIVQAQTDAGPVLINSFIAFDTLTGNHQDGFDNWNYANTLGSNGTTGGFYSNPDSTSHVQHFIPYYNGYNSDHMGWMRWGYSTVSTHFATGGPGCFIFTMTGGAYDDNGVVAYSGLEVTNKEQFDYYIANGDNPYSNINLPGGLTFYALSSETSSTHTFECLQGIDRLSLWVYLPAEVSHIGEARPNNTINYYPFIDDGAGRHYYHYVTNIALGSWTHVLFDAHPLHCNSGDPYLYDQYRVGAMDCPGQAMEYFSRTARFAIVIGSPLPRSPSSVYLDQIEAYKVAQYENDETVANIGAGYDPLNKEFDIGFCDKYRGTECSALYELRYSFNPITNANYAQSELATIIQDPNVSFSYTTSNHGEIKKPVNGYSQIWAKFALNTGDSNLLEEGTRIYFAVKDISNRTFPGRDPYDEEVVLVPNLGYIRRIDLIKTIDYEIFASPNTCLPLLMNQFPLWNQTIDIRTLINSLCP